MVKSCRVRVFGAVQGVSYRARAKAEAKRLSLVGLARNQPDGSVYMEVEGDQAKLNQFLAWCQKGSPSARVANIEIEEQTPQGYSHFTVV